MSEIGMTAKDIKAGVEELLGEPISRHSIKSQMHRGYLTTH